MCIYNIFGKSDLIEPLIKKTSLAKSSYKINHTNDFIKDEDSPLAAAKKGKRSSMWLSIESLKKEESDAIVSAGNTGALFVIAKLNLNMIEKIDKPALSALWPNKTGMNIVLDLGANIECNEKNLIDFSLMGSALHKSLFENEESKVALLNIGSEEMKGNNIIKNTYQTLNEKNNFVIKYGSEIQKTNQGTLLDNITYDGEEIYFPGESQYTQKDANFNGGFYFFLGIIHDITYSAQAWYPRIINHHTNLIDRTVKIVKDDNAIQHFLFVTSGTINVSEGLKQRNFKKESCLLLQKNKEYTLSQVGDEIMNVYEFKSVKKATTD